jgi:hypothetical protein
MVVGLTLGVAQASAADSRANDASASLCPEWESVWATVSKLVPDGVTSLAAAKPRVQIEDLGDRYRVRVTTPDETLERVYVDRERDCAKRNRFAAEFIVLALMPPRIAGGPPPSASAANSEPAQPPSSGGGSSSTSSGAESSTAGAPPARTASPSPPGAPPAPPPPSAPPPAAPSPSPAASAPLAPSPPLTAAPSTAVGPERPPGSPSSTPPLLRIELSAAFGAAPSVLDAPNILLWGGQIRARLGSGLVAIIAGASYWPRQSFHAGSFEGALTRVPSNVGFRLQDRLAWIELDGDLTFTVAYERYEGVSPKAPATASRFTPGSEVAFTARLTPGAAFAPFLSAYGAWFPSAQDITSAPAIVGKTPSLWVGLALGVSYSL